jgi:delta-aminolevulinic acid dehydratase/porphobilinogen synthase
MDVIKKLKMIVLKKMLGKKVFVVTNSLTDEGYCGIVNKVINDETLTIFSNKAEINVSIFDVRTPSRIYDCE